MVLQKKRLYKIVSCRGVEHAVPPYFITSVILTREVGNAYHYL